jgi:hypothetical protein
MGHTSAMGLISSGFHLRMFQIAWDHVEVLSPGSFFIPSIFRFSHVQSYNFLLTYCPLTPSLSPPGERGRVSRILIPGDVVYADYAIGRFNLYGAEASQLKKSLVRLGELEVDILLPGHNQIVKSLPKGYILKTAMQWEAYLK